MTLSSVRQLAHAIDRASDVTLASYTLGDGCVRRALVRAAERGARVTVRLDGATYRDDGRLAEANRDAVAVLTRAGADAEVVAAADAPAPPLHLKGAVVDGVTFLDDRNWRNGRDTVLRAVSRRLARSVRDAAIGRGDAPTRVFTVRKTDALAQEARLLASAHRGDDVVLESESFGAGNPVFAALEAAARRGVRVRLLVSQRIASGNARELAALQRLRESGVETRASDANEKFAVVDGARGWIGSANATSTFADAGQLDWGVRFSGGRVAARLRSAFARRWRANAPR